MKKTALITWASMWLGEEFAYQLTQRGYHCILTARSEDKLAQVQKNIISSWWTATYIPGDLSDLAFCAQLVAELNDTPISVLINNAWFGMYGDFLTLEREKQLTMLNLNCNSLTYLTHAFGTLMSRQTDPCFILNIASTASFQPWPTMATYFASKAFVVSLSRALQYELQDTNLHIGVLCPWPTKTEFFNHSNNKKGSLLMQNMMTAHEVVQIWLDNLFKKKTLIIPGMMNTFLYFLSSITPTRLSMSIIKKMTA
jgi:short-subunit dehydrogenase